MDESLEKLIGNIKNDRNFMDRIRLEMVEMVSIIFGNKGSYNLSEVK